VEQHFIEHECGVGTEPYSDLVAKHPFWDLAESNHGLQGNNYDSRPCGHSRSSHHTLISPDLQGAGGPGLLGAENILLRAAVAALLNSTNGSISYPFAKADIINAVNAAIATGKRDAVLALATILDNANNGTGGCPLSGRT
jgi:hypothetical protein